MCVQSAPIHLVSEYDWIKKQQLGFLSINVWVRDKQGMVVWILVVNIIKDLFKYYS